MLKIVAVLLFQFAGMETPKTIEKPVTSFEECQAEIGKMIEATKGQFDKGFQVLMGCKVVNEKSDPA